MEGYIYVLQNEFMPGIVKVGKTIHDPEVRAGQISSATGVPEKFSVFERYEVNDCDEAEKFAHRILEKVFGRPNSQREFFSGTAEEVSSVLDEALTPYISSGATQSITLYQSAIERVLKKEFTMAVAEFESILGQIHLDELEVMNNKSLETALGAYVASCYAVNKPPFHPVILSPRVKSSVTERAIEFAEEFEQDPASNIISYVRRCT